MIFNSSCPPSRNRLDPCKLFIWTLKCTSRVFCISTCPCAPTKPFCRPKFPLKFRINRICHVYWYRSLGTEHMESRVFALLCALWSVALKWSCPVLAWAVAKGYRRMRAGTSHKMQTCFCSSATATLLNSGLSTNVFRLVCRKVERVWNDSVVQHKIYIHNLI